MMLVTVDDAKKELHLGDDATCDDEIKDLIERSCDIIANWVKDDLDDYDPDGSIGSPIPGYLRSAVLLSVRAAYEGGDPLNETVQRLLWRMRDPAFA